MLVVAFVLATPALAGCLRKPDSEVEAAAAQNETMAAVPDGRGPIVAFEETNQTESGMGGVDHHHDMWMGRTRVTVVDTGAMMSPFPDTNGVAAEFSIPQANDSFVYEGTASVEFTISEPGRHACEPLVTFGGHFYCTDYFPVASGPTIPDPNPPAGLKLRYKHASTVEWIDAGELVWGTPTIIKITDPRQTDMPHATASIWEFRVESPNAQDATLTFRAKADIVRGEGDVPLWPGHPLFYTPEKPTRHVVENVQAKACDGGLTGVGCTLAGDGVEPVVPTKLISYGTRTLYVWLNVTNAQFPNPATAPTQWFLYHRNATGQTNITSLFDETYAVGNHELYWILPVDDGSMDSPYADGSRWEFELGGALTPPAGSSCYGGCADWYAEYTLSVVASSAELPGDEYHMYCLRPETYCGDE